MDIASLTNLASIVTIIVAVVFGTLQIRQMRKTRALFTVNELVHAIQTPAFSQSVRLVLTLPDRADPQRIVNDPEMTGAVTSLGHVYESLGVLVFHRILPLHLVDDLMGGYIRHSWLKLEPYIEWRRKELGVSYSEWTQWLAEQLLEHPSPGKELGAHIAHRGWKPN